MAAVLGGPGKRGGPEAPGSVGARECAPPGAGQGAPRPPLTLRSVSGRVRVCNLHAAGNCLKVIDFQAFAVWSPAQGEDASLSRGAAVGSELLLTPGLS